MARPMALTTEPATQMGRAFSQNGPGLLTALMVLFLMVHGTWIATSALPEPTSEWSQVVNAGKAVRSSQSMYRAETHGYAGSPILALLVAPLASSEIPPWLLPFFCYLVNAVSVVLAVHWLAGLVDDDKDVARWWFIRVIPVALLLILPGRELLGGVTQSLVLLLTARLAVSLSRHDAFGAGIWLAAAVAVQWTSLLLILVPICRRDRVMTMGTVLGLMLGMLLLPGMWFGLAGTNQANAEYLQSVQRAVFHDVQYGSTASIPCLIYQCLPATEQAIGLAFVVAVALVLGLILAAAWLATRRNLKGDVLLLLGVVLSLAGLMVTQHALWQIWLVAPSMIGMFSAISRRSVAPRVAIAMVTVMGTVILTYALIPGMTILSTLILWGMSMLILNQRPATGVTVVGESSTVLKKAA